MKHAPQPSHEAPAMKIQLFRVFIVCALIGAGALAILLPHRTYHPALSASIGDANAAMTFSFLMGGRGTQRECDATLGHMAQAMLKRCPQCSIQKLACKSLLDDAEKLLLTDAPLSRPSGRLRDGVVTFEASDSVLALASCELAQAQSAKSRAPLTCHPAGTLRPIPPPQTPFNPWSPLVLLSAFLATLATAWLMVRYEHLHAHFSLDPVDSGPQKYHEVPTPRIGGVAIMAGLLVACTVMLVVDNIYTERAFGLLLLAASPAFLGGLVEDVTKKVGVFERLLTTILAGVLAAWLLGAELNRLAIPIIDSALHWLPFSIVLTAFAVGGIANAINIIDGVNGLAMGVSLIALTALACVAGQVGDEMVMISALATMGAILGLIFWNWPYGRILLGDGCAYLIGFMVAELAVLLVVRNPSVSPWFPLLLLIYPIFETLYSVYRRKIQNQLSPGEPDNLHLHQLVRDRWIAAVNRNGSPRSALTRNSRTAVLFWGPTAILAIIGVACWQSTATLAGAAGGFCVIYVITYRRIISINSEAAVDVRGLET